MRNAQIRSTDALRRVLLTVLASSPISWLDPPRDLVRLKFSNICLGQCASGWTAQHQGGKHWDITNSLGSTVRVRTDAEAYEHADGRLQWWQGPPHEKGNETRT